MSTLAHESGVLWYPDIFPGFSAGADPGKSDPEL